MLRELFSFSINSKIKINFLNILLSSLSSLSSCVVNLLPRFLIIIKAMLLYARRHQMFTLHLVPIVVCRGIKKPISNYSLSRLMLYYYYHIIECRRVIKHFFKISLSLLLLKNLCLLFNPSEGKTLDGIFLSIVWI